jgi:hypothetical protein
MLKVADGRCRIAGPGGEPPQIWITTTPRKNWLYEYFGELSADDPHASFKDQIKVIDLLTADNEANLAAGFVADRRRSLTEAEARVLLEAAWEDIDDAERFLASMSWWDACYEELPPLTNHEPMVIALDAGVSSDSFGLVAVTRHPTRRGDIAVRHVQEWRPVGGKIDYQYPESTLRALIASWDVVQVCYDPYQLHDMMTRIKNEGVVYVSPFAQGGERLEADRQLYDLIMQRRLAHPGDPALRAHIDHANKKPDPETRRLRLWKRVDSLKIDLAVCLSMAAYRCLNLNL